jgi:hypothetical protein
VRALERPGTSHLIKRGPQAFGQLDRRVIGPKMHEEQARLFGEHVAMHRGHLDLILPQRPDDRIDLVGRENNSLAARTKSPVIAALPPPGGWKLIEVATPIGPAGTSVISHRLLRCRPTDEDGGAFLGLALHVAAIGRWGKTHSLLAGHLCWHSHNAAPTQMGSSINSECQIAIRRDPSRAETSGLPTTAGSARRSSDEFTRTLPAPIPSSARVTFSTAGGTRSSLIDGTF